MASLDVMPLNPDADGAYFNKWLYNNFSGRDLVSSVVYLDDRVTISFTTSISAAQTVEINDFYSSLTPADGLDDVKDELIAEVVAHRDLRLETVITAEYPSGSGKRFSCSVASQDSWSKLATLDARGLVTYPFAVKTFDYKDSYNIVDSTDLTGIIGTVSSYVLGERDIAEGYIDSVLAATTEEAARAAIAPYFE